MTHPTCMSAHAHKVWKDPTIPNRHVTVTSWSAGITLTHGLLFCENPTFYGNLNSTTCCTCERALTNKYTDSPNTIIWMTFLAETCNGVKSRSDTLHRQSTRSYKYGGCCRTLCVGFDDSGPSAAHYTKIPVIQKQFSCFALVNVGQSGLSTFFRAVAWGLSLGWQPEHIFHKSAPCHLAGLKLVSFLVLR